MAKQRSQSGLRRRDFLQQAAAGIALSVTAACGLGLRTPKALAEEPPEEGDTGTTKIDNVILVVSDTLRRDHLGCYGNRWIRTPNMDGFAKEAVVFDHAYEASFPTMPTRADYFTGKLTLTYLGWAPLGPDETTLAQLLRQAGLYTIAVVDTPFYVRDGMNYDRGFTHFRWILGQEAQLVPGPPRRREGFEYCAPRTFAEAEKWLERNYKERFFLLIDTWDPHEPWNPPRHYVKPYLPDYDGRMVGPVYGKWRGRVSEGDLKVARACYAGEITMVDFWFGRLMQRLESLDLLEKTAIIFTSDHGFYFGEHGYFGKAVIEGEDGTPIWRRSPLYDEVTRVPLLILAPRMKPQRLPALVCHPDLMPTVLGFAGVKPPKNIYGRSLLPLMRGSRKPIHDIVISSAPLCNLGEVTRAVDDIERRVRENLPSTIFDGEWTLLYSIHGERSELYHTKSDPQQKRNLFSQHVSKARELHAEFVATLESQGTEDRLLETRRDL